MATFELSTLDTGIGLRDEHMKEKYLEVGKYPISELKLDHMELTQTSGKNMPFHGVLKLHGVERPVEGSFDLEQTYEHRTNIKAEFSVRLSNFGIEIPHYLGITIADEVKLTVVASGLSQH